jgi:ABC-type Fe3+-hydroxamate transport system substrate-binding protein
VEFILIQDPEVIILPYMGRNFGQEALRQRHGWANISAVRNDRIYDDIGSHVITIPSPRLILHGLPELLQRIHPEIMKEGKKK